MSAPTTTPDALELKPEEEAELHRLLRMYRRESSKCLRSGAHLAACVMSGAALEVMLILAVDVYGDEAVATGKLPKKKGKALKPLLDWNLAELLTVAKAAGWLPSALQLTERWNRRKAKIGDYAEVVRMLRNLVHPAKYIEDNFKKQVTKTYTFVCNNIIELITEIMITKIGKSIDIPDARGK